MNGKLILVSGYCATGKSTFSRNLSRQLGIPCFNKDTIKESMADGFGAESKEVEFMGSRATFRVMAHVAECFLKIGKACILEANFKPQEGEQLDELAKRHGAECLTFVFTGDLDVLYDRYVKREDAGERHWVHMSAGLRESFRDMHVQYNVGQIAVGQTVNIDSTVFENVEYEKFYEIAGAFVKEGQHAENNY